VDCRHIVEGPTVALYVLDHEVVLAVHQVLDADCSPASSFRPKMFSTHWRGLARGPKFVEVFADTFRPAYGPFSISHTQRLYSPLALSLDSMSKSLPT
jgi:hypothetical protein